MEKFKIIREEIEKIKQTFNLQLQEINKNKNINQFHDYLTDITLKYPENKDLIKFVVFINDELNRNQQFYNEIISDTINQYLEKNKELLDHLIINKKNEKTPKTKIVDKLKKISLKDIKIILLSIIIILILVITIIDSSLLDKIFTYIFKLFKTIF